MKKIISFLGTGRYSETTYEWTDNNGDRTTVRTKFVQEAIYEIVGNDAVVYVGLTDKARNEKWENHNKTINRKVMMVDDCIMAMNSLGEMGDCHSCRYFRADRQGVQMDFYDTVKGKSGVNADSWFLMHMIEAVREGIGFKENIKTALLRLQHSCKHYRDCLITKYERDDGYGKT